MIVANGTVLVREPLAPRHGRRVTVGDLDRLASKCGVRKPGFQSHSLYCRKCGRTYSAEPGDYFSARPNSVFGCCGVNNWLMRRKGA